MKRLLLWGAGIALGIWVVRSLRSPAARQVQQTAIDLNAASREELLQLPGMEDAIADRIIENRPYRHRLDLVARRIIPSGLYQEIHSLVDVDHAVAAQPINVAL